MTIDNQVTESKCFIEKRLGFLKKKKKHFLVVHISLCKYHVFCQVSCRISSKSYINQAALADF